MKIYPAIDLYDGQAVRLLRGDYQAMDVYSKDPVQVAKTFEACGAKCLHLVDLEGARTGQTPNREVIRRLIGETSLFVEVGGGIRSLETAETYLELGANRVIFGTAAVTEPGLVEKAVRQFGDQVTVGLDVRDGFVAIRGWTESSGIDCFSFCERLQQAGVRTIICTDISKDGALEGSNRQLYADLKAKFTMEVIASGGVSSLEDVRALREMGVEGAIIGKAYYTGKLNLAEAIAAGRGDTV